MRKHPAMRKLVAGFASSLDGYIEGPNGEYDWILIDKEIDFAEQAKRFDAYFYGRRSYEMALLMGNKATDGAKHYVFSRTLTNAENGFVLMKDDVRSAVMDLKNQTGKDIAVFGGANLLASLLDLELVDELTVSIIPVLLGSGKPMVESLKEKIWLSTQHTKTYGNGTVQVTYSVNYKIV